MSVRAPALRVGATASRVPGAGDLRLDEGRHLDRGGAHARVVPRARQPFRHGPLAARGLELVHVDRPPRLRRRPGSHAGVLPGLPDPGRGPRPRDRELRPRRAADLARLLRDRVRAALAARPAAPRRRRRDTLRPLPGALPDGRLPRRRLLRVALPGAVPRCVRPRRARSLGLGLARGGRGHSHALRRGRRRLRPRRDGVAEHAEARLAAARPRRLRRLPDRAALPGARRLGLRARAGQLAAALLVGGAARRPLGRRSGRCGTRRTTSASATTWRSTSRTCCT